MDEKSKLRGIGAGPFIVRGSFEPSKVCPWISYHGGRGDAGIGERAEPQPKPALRKHYQQHHYLPPLFKLKQKTFQIGPSGLLITLVHFLS